MPDLSLIHVFVLISLTVALVAIVSSYQRARATWARRSKSSRRFQEAAAASLLVAKFDRLVMTAAADAREGAGCPPKVLIPTGDGQYLVRTGGGKADLWLNALERWLKWGASITMIVTIPSEEARALWMPLTSKSYVGTLRVVFLHRDEAPTEETRAEIGKLDTFHPCLLVTGTQENGRPAGAMWVEHYHAVGSPVAQNIEFVAPIDAARDIRFAKYFSAMNDLLSLGPPCVEVMESLSQSAPTAENKKLTDPAPPSVLAA